MAYLLHYVDDIVLTASSTDLRRIITALQVEFAMKDLGPLHHFLSVSVQRSSSGMFLSQKQYALDILQCASMAKCKPCNILVDKNPKLAVDDGPPMPDATHFRSLAGALQYLFSCM